MHERYLVGQPQPQPRDSSNSNSNDTSSTNSSSNSMGGEELVGADESENGKKKKSNGNPSPPPSPYYGNILVDSDHLLPLQHYILQQAKLSGIINLFTILVNLKLHVYSTVENKRGIKFGKIVRH